MPRVTARGWVSADRTHPCPICGAVDYCGSNPQKKLAHCMRRRPEWFSHKQIQPPLKPLKESSQGGYMYLYENGKDLPAICPDDGTPVLNRKSDDEIDRAYRKIFQMLPPLNDKQLEHLEARGMSSGEVALRGYRQYPEDKRYIEEKFEEEEAEGIPGFAYVNGRFRLTGSPGIAIPVLSYHRKLVSLKVRLDIPVGKMKYQVISTGNSNWTRGASAGARLHIARAKLREVASRQANSSVAWIVEGPLKADIVAWRLNVPVIGVCGASNWKEIKSLPRLPAKAVIAYDMDLSTNRMVQASANAMSEYLKEKGVEVAQAVWEAEKAKGPDDALVSDVPIQEIVFRYKFA